MQWLNHGYYKGIGIEAQIILKKMAIRRKDKRMG
jgi:hypothetical protein